MATKRSSISKTNSQQDNEFLNELAKKLFIVAQSKGFYKTKSLQMGDYCAKLHGEVSELFEAYRKSQLYQQCDKNTPELLTCAEEELADVIIQALEISHRLNINIGRAIRVKTEYNKTRSYRNGGKKA